MVSNNSLSLKSAAIKNPLNAQAASSTSPKPNSKQTKSNAKNALNTQPTNSQKKQTTTQLSNLATPRFNKSNVSTTISTTPGLGISSLMATPSGKSNVTTAEQNYTGPQIAMASQPIISHTQVNYLMQRITSAGTPLTISSQAAQFIAVFLDNLLVRLFGAHKRHLYNLDDLVHLLAPPPNYVPDDLPDNTRHAYISPIHPDIAELIRENGKAAIIERSRGHDVLKIITPAEMMTKVSKYKSYENKSGQAGKVVEGKRIILDEEACVFLASSLQYLVTEIGSACYQHDFKSFISSRDVKAIVSVNDEALSKLYAFANPGNYKSIMNTRNNRAAWNTPRANGASGVPRRWGTPLASRSPSVSWDLENSGSPRLNSKRTPGRTPFGTPSRTPRTPEDFMRDFRQNRKSPLKRSRSLYNDGDNADDSFFEDVEGPVPSSKLVELFRRGHPDAVKYRGMRMADIYSQIEFEHVRRTFPMKNFGGAINSEFSSPDPLFGYAPKGDVFLATFSADGTTVIVQFKVRKEELYYVDARTVGGQNNAGRPAWKRIYNDRRYVWMLMH